MRHAMYLGALLIVSVTLLGLVFLKVTGERQVSAQSGSTLQSELEEITRKCAQEDSDIHKLEWADEAEKEKRWAEVRERRTALRKRAYESRGLTVPSK